MSARGELVVIEEAREYPSGLTYSVELVAGVRRDGTVVRTVSLSAFNHDGRYAGMTTDATEHDEVLIRQATSAGRKVDRWRCYATGRTWKVEADTFDTAGAWAALHGRRPEGSPWSPGQFDTIDAVRDFLAPYRTSAESAA